MYGPWMKQWEMTYKNRHMEAMEVMDRKVEED
jgi:hypothetical protein